MRSYVMRKVNAAAAVAVTAAVLLATLWAAPCPAASGDASGGAAMEPYTETITGPHGDKATFEMLPIPKPGSGASLTFTMGSPAGEANRKEDEGPQFKVTVEPFWMAKYETTWAMYRKFVEEYPIMIKARAKGAYTIPDARSADAVSVPTPIWEQDAGPRYKALGFTDKDPAAAMSQFGAKQFTKWLSKKTGKFYRLPTAAEWEFACRAGTTTAYSFGDDPDKMDDYGWSYKNSMHEDLDKGFPDIGAGYRPVGMKKPNPWGLYDMHGNVAEWVLDQYLPDHYKKFAGKTVSWREAIAWPTTHFPREVRGGSWYMDPEDCRCASRRGSQDQWRKDDPMIPKSVWFFTTADAFSTGFRVIHPLNEPTDAEKHKFWEPDVDLIRNVLKEKKQGQVLVDDPPSAHLKE
jgi:formylglycine-generating enzyme required for sulfatase activity